MILIELVGEDFANASEDAQIPWMERSPRDAKGRVKKLRIVIPTRTVQLGQAGLNGQNAQFRVDQEEGKEEQGNAG